MTLSLTLPERHILKRISSRQGISRKALAEELGSSQASVTKVTKRLLENQLIIEGERVSRGLGRREVLLYSNPERFRYLGIDVGGYMVRMAVADNNMQVVESTHCYMKESMEWVDKSAFLIHHIDEFLSEGKVFDAIGIGVTGIVNARRDTILSIPNASGWDGVQVVDKISEHFGCPVFLEEGGRSMAIAEQISGKAQGVEDFVVVHVGFGLVAGIVINGQLVRGANNIGGLLGHVTADEQAGRCLCGNYGCLENIITFPMLEQAYGKRGGSLPSLVEAYGQNDKVALDVCVDAGRALGVALSNVVNLFNPRAIYLGGGVFEHFSLLFEETKRTILLRAIRFATVGLSLEKSSFGDLEGVMGAIAVAKSAFTYGQDA